MDAQSVRTFIKSQLNLSTTPALLGKILSAVKEDSSPQDLTDVILHDQALAQRVMRLANSAFFGHSGQVKDIPQAIMLLGYDRVRAVAIGMSAMHLLPSRTGFQIQNLWAHGYETAFLASLISERVGLTRPDECFLSGLLHDVGRVIFYMIDHALFQQLETGDDMLQREERLFGCTHAEAGAWYAELLMLPPEHAAVLRYHHHPSAARDNTGMVSIIALAEALCRKFNPRIEDDGIWSREHDAILLEFTMNDEAITALKEESAEVRGEIERFF